MPAAGEHHPAFEEYCECIFELQEDDVTSSRRIATVCRSPAVSEMIRCFEAEGLVTSDGSIEPPKHGHRQAVRRHLAERFRDMRSACRGRSPITRRASGST
jgi:DtxR family Mn-dependent transcriptional regulator